MDGIGRHMVEAASRNKSFGATILHFAAGTSSRHLSSHHSQIDLFVITKDGGKKPWNTFFKHRFDGFLLNTHIFVWRRHWIHLTANWSRFDESWLQRVQEYVWFPNSSSVTPLVMPSLLHHLPTSLYSRWLGLLSLGSDWPILPHWLGSWKKSCCQV